MNSCSHHRYWQEQQAGARARSEQECPYRAGEIGKRCAWLAGFRDANRRLPCAA